MPFVVETPPTPCRRGDALRSQAVPAEKGTIAGLALHSASRCQLVTYPFVTNATMRPSYSLFTATVTSIPRHFIDADLSQDLLLHLRRLRLRQARRDPDEPRNRKIR